MSNYFFRTRHPGGFKLSSLCFDVLTRFIPPRLIVQCLLKARRHILTALDRVYLPIVTRECLRDGRGPWRTESFGAEDAITLPTPTVVGAEPDELARVPRQFRFRKPFVSVITNAALISPSALALDSNRKILMESVGPDFDNGAPGFFALPMDYFWKRMTMRPDIVIEAPVCSLVTTFGWIYGHWLIEGLPRLEGYELYRQRSGDRPLLLIDENPRSWKLQSLELLGYGPADVMRWTHPAARVKTLILPSIRRQSGWPEPRACAWLRERLIGALPPPEPSAPRYAARVVVSRGNSPGRRILNEDALMDALVPLGFARYQTDAMHFADEVRLFSGAEIIVSMHGSGLMNAVMSPNRPLVIDLFDAFWTTEFIKLAAVIGARYACVRCQPVRAKAHGRWLDNDCLVDVGAIVRLIQAAEAEQSR
jgi:hypothetical protein